MMLVRALIFSAARTVAATTDAHTRPHCDCVICCFCLLDQ
jgi:hypothetical protein